MPKWTEEQALAINEKGKNIIVSAGAGSGKTAVLSERVLTHVLSGMGIDDLLILTFTNAAASEMKERIRKKLSLNSELKDQLDKVDLAYITTFDAFALSLVKKYNYLLNMSDNVSIIDDSIIKLKKKEILTDIFEEYYKNEDSRFLKLINDFCLKDDKEIFKAIIDLNDKMDNLYNKRDYLENYISGFYDGNIINGFISEYVGILCDKACSIKNTVDNLSSYVDYSYIEKINEVIGPLLNSKTYMDFKFNSIIKLPQVPRGSSEEAKAIKASLSDLIKEINVLTKYKDDDEIRNSIFMTKDYALVIVEILLELDKRINDFKYENEAYEFTDIAKMAISILEKHEDVREELKGKYKEILIDEYQDTNDLQDLFISYISNDDVYMVGDVKQSIYRFRNANPLLFKGKYDQYSNNDGGMKIDLNKNFRSRRDVTENINLIFNMIMDNEIGGADYISSHQMVFGNTAYDNVDNEDYSMEILNYEMPDDKYFSKEEIEIFMVARDIQNKVNNHFKVMDQDTLEERDITYGDFAILMDRATAFEKYKKVFEYLNIPLTIYRDTSVSDSVDILLIKNLYNLIISISEKRYDTLFKYSFMSIARSYLFNMADADIFRIFKDNKFYETEIFKKCKKISDELDILSNKELYDRIIYGFDFYKRIITTGNIDNHLVTLESISKIVSNVSNFGYTPKDFLDYLNDISDEGLDIKLSLNKDSSNSVKIMTIHASKGLEYHVCYFSGLYKKFNIDDLKNKFYFSNDYGILIPYMDNGPKNTILKTLFKQKYIHAEVSEKLRLFYVALTRAREKMVMICELKPNILSFKDNGIINNEVRTKYLSFNDMLSSVSDYIGKYVRNVNINELGLTKDYNLTKKSNYRENLELTDDVIVVNEYEGEAKEIFNKRFSKDNHSLYSKEEANNIKLGLQMHSLFELIDFSNPDYSGIDEFKKRKVERFINSGILDDSINLYKEYEFVYEVDGMLMHGFIDLLIEYEDRFAIIDYKLKNTADEAYMKQLNGYLDYIMSISDKPVCIYLYSIMDEKLVKLN
ncbi:MAG: UvrD-helicase domain-containing protein [Bacilli bacterium]|nr:UvrD-helicase domain-containing protein [Bacilli bacterium]MCI9585029.1 UvrD-helicase domain-containing protein [Bacilli bacterium]